MKTYLPLIISLIVVVAFYVMLVIAVRARNVKARALRSLYLPEDSQLGENRRRNPLAIFCKTALEAVGINLGETRKSMYQELGAAGIATEESASYFLFFRFFVQGFLILIGVMLLLSALLDHELQFLSLAGGLRLLIVLTLVGIGLGGHKVVLDKMTKSRKLEMTRSFPDAMDLLLVCVEAGMPLDSALARVCRELEASQPTITRELDRTRIELGVFGDRKQSLQNLADRTDVKPFRTLAAALIQTEKYGTNLADTLRVLADEMRTERLLNAENKAARIPVLITIPLITLILFPFLGLIMAPPIIKLNQTTIWDD